MGHVELDGYRLAYQVRGPSEAPPLLLIMGLGMAADAWDTLPDRLAERFRVITFDNRGVGSSTLGEGPYSIDRLGDDAARVLDAVAVDRAAVFGISMGGMIAQELALRHPGRITRLVLGATFGGHLWSTKPSPLVAMDLLLVNTLGRQTDRMARLLVSDGFYRAERDRFERWLKGLSRAPRATVQRQILAIARHEAEDRLARLEVPTLVLSGDHDRLVPVENSRKLARRIPGARLVELPGVGHAFPFEATRPTVEALLAHLEPLARAG